MGCKSGQKWTPSVSPVKAKAAVLIAEDELSVQEIAEAVGTSDRTLRHWKAEPLFAQAVRVHAATVNWAVSRFSVSKRRKRVAILQRQVDSFLRIMDERATDPDFQTAPGAARG